MANVWIQWFFFFFLFANICFLNLFWWMGFSNKGFSLLFLTEEKKKKSRNLLPASRTGCTICSWSHIVLLGEVNCYSSELGWVRIPHSASFLLWLVYENWRNKMWSFSPWKCWQFWNLNKFLLSSQRQWLAFAFMFYVNHS